MHLTLWIALIGATVAFVCVVIRVFLTRGPVSPVGLLAYFITNK